MYIARILVKGISEGDTQRLDFLFNRLIGKVKEKKEISLPKPTIIKMIDGKTELVMGSNIVNDIDEDESNENNS